MNIFLILSGVALLIAGHRLFWLFVGISGFAAAYEWSRVFFGPAATDMLTLVLPVAVGLIGALFSIFFYRLALILGGFLAGGYLGAFWGMFLFPGAEMTFGLAFLAGGLLGGLLMLIVIDWALIILSSLIGAVLILNSFSLAGEYKIFLLAVIVFVGIFVQTKIK